MLVIMADNYIIHASGKVRIDRIDHLGIFNAETNKHTHKLRVIKKLFKKNTCLSLDRYFIYYETNIYCFAFNALYSAVISKAL
jgi:hypothetical protein